MAILYSSSGTGSDFHIMGLLISGHNRERYLLTDATNGLEAKIRTDLTTNFNTSANDNKRAANSALIESVNAERDDLPNKKGTWKSRLDDWLLSSIYEGLDSRSRSVSQVLFDLQTDMYANSKKVTASVGNAVMVGSPNTHVYASKIHAAASLANLGTLVNAEKFTDLSSEVLSFMVSSPQNAQGVVTFDVYGEPSVDEAPNLYPDTNGGLGNLGRYTTSGWTAGGFVNNNGAQSAPRNSDEIASEWRRFATANDADDNTPYDTAPASVGWARVTGATPVTGDCYYGSTAFKCTGDNTQKRMYLAQLVHNPNLDVNTTAWGSSANNTTLSRIKASDDGKVLFVSFRYKGVPTGHTLLPKIIYNGSTRSADATIQGVTADGSSTWRQAVYAFLISSPPGFSTEHVIAALELRNGGSVIPATTVAYADVLKVEVGTVIANLWIHGVPNHAPLAIEERDRFTLTKTSEGKWQKYFTDNYTDRFGQRVQLPSGTATESESLVLFTDA